MLGAFIPDILEKMDDYMKKMENEVLGKVERLDSVVSFFFIVFEFIFFTYQFRKFF